MAEEPEDSSHPFGERKGGRVPTSLATPRRGNSALGLKDQADRERRGPGRTEIERGPYMTEALVCDGLHAYRFEQGAVDNLDANRDG